MKLDKVLIAKKTEISVIITHSVMWLELGLRMGMETGGDIQVWKEVHLETSHEHPGTVDGT